MKPFDNIFTSEANTLDISPDPEVIINYHKGISFTPKLEIIAEDEDLMPFYAHPGDAGMDLRASEEMFINPGEIVKVDTGLKISVPQGFVGLVVPRSSLGSKGITVANSPGTIDSGYRGPLMVVLINHTSNMYYVDEGERIAQLLIVPVATAKITRVSRFSDAETSRGDGGFGSTGAN